MMPDESPIVREVRERAKRIEQRFDNDLHKYCEHLREEEKKHADRVVDQIAVVRSSISRPSPLNSGAAVSDRRAVETDVNSKVGGHVQAIILRR